MNIAVLAFCASLLALPASAQTADELLGGRALQDIWIQINARDWQALRTSADSNTFYPCDVEWRGVKAHNAGCRSRGRSSRNSTKPGLLLEFDRYVTGQRFLGRRTLVLDNLWQDASMLKERVSMGFFRKMGIQAPRASHARLYVGADRQFRGLYGVVEEIDERFLQRALNDGGGYVYEYHWIDDYRLTDLGPDLDRYAVRFEPRTHRRDSATALYTPIRDMVRAVTDAPAADLERTLAPYLDVRGIVAYVAVENFLAEMDGFVGFSGVNNFYLYRPGGSSRAGVIPWDKDLTFGWIEMPPWHNLAGNALMSRAWADPALRRVYLDTLTAAAAAAPWLEEEVARDYAEIRDAARADQVKPVTNEEFEADAARVATFTRDRAAIVRHHIAQLASQPAVRH